MEFNAEMPQKADFENKVIKDINTDKIIHIDDIDIEKAVHILVGGETGSRKNLFIKTNFT